MLIHIAPRLFASQPSELVDICIPEISLCLTAKNDLMMCRPYRNQRYLVACLKGKYGHEGLIIKAPYFLKKFTVHTRWNVIGEGIAEHIVNYTVADDFDMTNGMITDNFPRMEVKPELDLFQISTNIVDETVGSYLKKRSEDRFVSSVLRMNYNSHRSWNHMPALDDFYVVAQQS